MYRRAASRDQCGVKVLPTELAADPQLRARFEREARAISALAHPNICTLYDVGEENGRTYLVMEHLVGETLAERLKKGPLPLERVLEIGAQIADGSLGPRGDALRDGHGPSCLRGFERGESRRGHPGEGACAAHSPTGRTTAIPHTDTHSVGDRVLVNGSCASGSGPARACRAHGLQGRSPGSPWCCV